MKLLILFILTIVLHHLLPENLMFIIPSLLLFAALFFSKHKSPKKVELKASIEVFIQVLIAIAMTWLVYRYLISSYFEKSAVAFDINKVIYLCIFVPICEELFFRGYVWEYLEKSGKCNCVQTVFYNAVIFTAFHITLQPGIWSLLVIFPALYFAYLRHHYGHWGYAAFAHAAFNAYWFFGNL